MRKRAAETDVGLGARVRSGVEMDIFIDVLLLIIGLLLIVKGGDWFVDAASWIAEISGIPTFIIGATIVSVATTLPEVFVSTIAAANGSVDMAIGNAIGSVNCNIALIMAISLLFLPSKIKRRDYVAKSMFLLLSVALIWGFSADGTLNLWQSIVIMLVFVAFIIENVYTARKKTVRDFTIADAVKVDEYHQAVYDADFTLNADGTVSRKKHRVKAEPKIIVKNVILFVLGAAGIVGGAQLLVDSGTSLAALAGVPEGIIGVTIMAVGTSLPELVTTVSAIIKKKSELSVGNVIGANIIDMTLILPLCAFIGGGTLPVSAQTLTLDLPFCLAVSALAVLPSLVTGKFKRRQGVLMLAGYITYITLLIVLKF